jgi:hypothetical protein
MGGNGRRITMTLTNNSVDPIVSVSQWINLTEIPLFYVGIIIAGALVLIVFLLNQRKSKKLATQLEKLQKDLMVANSTTIGMGQKLIHLEKQLQANEQDTRNQPTINQPAINQKSNQKSSENSLDNAQYKRQKTQPVDVSEQEDIPVSNVFAKQIKPVLSVQQKNDNSSNLSLVNNDFLQRDQLPSDEAYEKSRQLLSQGVDIPEIVKQSGLSFSEVALMKKLAQ